MSSESQSPADKARREITKNLRFLFGILLGLAAFVGLMYWSFESFATVYDLVDDKLPWYVEVGAIVGAFFIVILFMTAIVALYMLFSEMILDPIRKARDEIDSGAGPEA